LAGRKRADRLAAQCGDSDGSKAHSAALKKIAPRRNKATVSEGMIFFHHLINIEELVT
jgi:hypothetical protein